MINKERQLILIIWRFCTTFLELIGFDVNLDIISTVLSIIITAIIYYVIGVIILYFIDGVYKVLSK